MSNAEPISIPKPEVVLVMLDLTEVWRGGLVRVVSESRTVEGKTVPAPVYHFPLLGKNGQVRISESSDLEFPPYLP